MGLRFSDWNSVIMQARTSSPKNWSFPKLHQKGKQDRQKSKFSLSPPTDSPWLDLIYNLWLLSQILVLTLTLLGPFNLVNHLPCFSTQNQVLWEKPFSLGHAPSLPAPTPPWFIFLVENVSQLATVFSKMKLFHEGPVFSLNSLRVETYTCCCHSLLYS